jgi:hypothetical protein
MTDPDRDLDDREPDELDAWLMAARQAGLEEAALDDDEDDAA